MAKRGDARRRADGKDGGSASSPDASAGSTDASAGTPSRGFVGDVVGSVFEPGINRSVILLLNFSFVGLVLSLLFLGFVWEFNAHVLFLLVCTSILIGFMQWFLAQMPESFKNGAVPTAAAPKQ